ncbi:hypothetical protein D1P53_002883 [Cryptococcus gattii VGV]|nr:hypothetical protein D1P53_002883 [Cryptococcus gattii VGV]
MQEPFGSFGWICSHTVLPQCNLFFRQLFENDSPFLTTLFPESSDFFSQYNVKGRNSNEDLTVLAAKRDAGTGVGSNCEIARVGQRGSSGDVALIVLSALAVLIALLFAFRASRRWAAVGRVELRLLFVAFGVRSAFQIVTMTSLLKQGSKGLVIWNALIASQVVEDGTAAALVPLSIFSILFFVAALYISLDTGLHWTQAFHLTSTEDAEDLKGTALFVFSLILPAAFSVLYVFIMLYIVIKVLDERKPASKSEKFPRVADILTTGLVLYLASFAFFVAAQLIFFLASQPLCNASNGKVNSAFITTFLEVISMTLVYLAWLSITEDDWGQNEYGMY